MSVGWLRENGWRRAALVIYRLKCKAAIRKQTDEQCPENTDLKSLVCVSVEDCVNAGICFKSFLALTWRTINVYCFRGRKKSCSWDVRWCLWFCVCICVCVVCESLLCVCEGWKGLKRQRVCLNVFEVGYLSKSNTSSCACWYACGMY